MNGGVHAALSVMEADVFAAAAAPLFEAELVDALIWSPDVAFDRPLSEWCESLLDHYAGAGRLSAHGVRYSPFSAGFSERQKTWLASLAAEMKRRRYVRLSEHVGFMTAGRFERGAPMPVPWCEAALDAARASLARLRDAAQGLPLGLENLALAFSTLDVDAQGPLLDALTRGPGDFVVLDLHNLYCQAVNFSLDPLTLLATYPLARVKEIHVAGGRWSYPVSDPERRAFRRDTHDGAVPDRVFELLGETLAHCPAVERVVLEALPVSLATEPARDRFRTDFERMRSLLATPRTAMPLPPPPAAPPFSCTVSVAQLETYQTTLLTRLHERRDSPATLGALLADPALTPFHDFLMTVEPRALEVATELAATWGSDTAAGDLAG